MYFYIFTIEIQNAKPYIVSPVWGCGQNNNKRGDTMSNQLNQALASAAASSAMEGMPLSDKDLSKVQGFYDKLKNQKSG